jgi:L-seryl-tRNA(Ser) seleniumtransferase
LPTDKQELYRALPSMNALLELFADPSTAPGTEQRLRDGMAALASSLPRPVLREYLDAFLDSLREDIASKGRLVGPGDLALPALLPRMLDFVERRSRPHFRPVLNATGVVIHTNLGRSPLAKEAVEAVKGVMDTYSNLEFDLDSGSRGSRYSHVEGLVRRLTGAEAALVVNNNAAAVLITLDTLCRGGEVVVSRGELVEIGGSFRIPEVMEKSGCVLREVGATNRTHLKDYAAGINERTTALMKVHTSNYRIIGFTGSVERRELADLAHQRGLPLLEDLGSGTLVDFPGLGFPQLSGEPTAAYILRQGTDVVSFSADKLLGGPQAGIIAGKREYVERIKANPLNRALRVDKMTLAALEATLRLYLDPNQALERVPTLAMILMSPDLLRRRARKLAAMLKKHLPGEGAAAVRASLRSGVSRTGGGAFPEYDLPTTLVCLESGAVTPDAARQALLGTEPPLVARVENDALALDPRTLKDVDFFAVARVLVEVYGAAPRATPAPPSPRR